MNLRNWLFINRMTVTEFAEAIGVDRTYVYHWRTGNRAPTDKLMKKIFKVTKGKVKTAKDLKE